MYSLLVDLSLLGYHFRCFRYYIKYGDHIDKWPGQHVQPDE